MFSIKSDTADLLRLRIHFLRYEAHVDLLEGISFLATINLSVLFLSDTVSGLPTNSFDFALRFCPSWLWFTSLITLAFGQFWASLLNRLKARCWLQFTVTIVFMLYVALVLLKTIWLPSPRDYCIFAAFSCLSFFRLKREIGQAKKSQTRRVTNYDFVKRLRAERIAK